MGLYSTIVTTLAFLAIVAFAGGLVLIGAVAHAGARAGLVSALGGQERHPIGWAAALALIAMAGSLYLSEVVGLVPCSLCWYQRFAMYPLALLLGFAAVRDWVGVWRFALPLSLIGLAIAAYHVTIQWRPTLDVGACTSGAPCTGRYLAVFGFVSIPTMAGSVFLAVSALMLLLRLLERAEPGVVDPPEQEASAD